MAQLGREGIRIQIKQSTLSKGGFRAPVARAELGTDKWSAAILISECC